MKVVGVDEVGRGPIAGPLAVCAACFNDGPGRKFAGIKDSKKLTERQREKWYGLACAERDAGRIDFAVCFVGPEKIDKIGIAPAMRLAAGRALTRLTVSSAKTLVLLDGGLKAPKKFTNQKTIIKGDEKEQAIALASVIAKVTRDRRMKSHSKKFPEYGFEEHKGYGTKAHFEKIKKHGVCKIHRKTFIHGLH